MVVIKVRYPDGSSRRFRCETTFWVGTAKDCGVRLDGTDLPPHVLKIEVADPDVTIAPQDLRANAYLNDWQIDPDFLHVLHVGDQLRVLGHVLLFELVAGTAEEVRRFLGETSRDPDATERDLLAALRAEPDSAVAREVYADWLDGVGRCAEAEFVRLQWLTKERTVLDPKAFSSTWLSHDFQALRFRLRDLGFVTDPARRALVSRPAVICREQSCGRRWDQMLPDEHDDLFRRCGTCNKDVEFCSTFDQLSDAGTARKPAAVDPVLVMEVARQAYANRDFDEPTNPRVELEDPPTQPLVDEDLVPTTVTSTDLIATFSPDDEDDDQPVI